MGTLCKGKLGQPSHVLTDALQTLLVRAPDELPAQVAPGRLVLGARLEDVPLAQLLGQFGVALAAQEPNLPHAAQDLGHLPGGDPQGVGPLQPDRALGGAPQASRQIQLFLQVEVLELDHLLVRGPVHGHFPGRRYSREEGLEGGSASPSGPEEHRRPGPENSSPRPMCLALGARGWAEESSGALPPPRPRRRLGTSRAAFRTSPRRPSGREERRGGHDLPSDWACLSARKQAKEKSPLPSSSFSSLPLTRAGGEGQPRRCLAPCAGGLPPPLPTSRPKAPSEPQMNRGNIALLRPSFPKGTALWTAVWRWDPKGFGGLAGDQLKGRATQGGVWNAWKDAGKEGLPLSSPENRDHKQCMETSIHICVATPCL
ncbi:uncharacterized protein LOC143831164 [Paroedura picta]|uniref:uncharacterized protein LOC143831164 n=1 Tax=Paroedura picta TaxID=143630 RepID=UPI004055D305